MTSERLRDIRRQVGRKVDAILAAGQRLSPLDLHARLEEIRLLAVDNNLPALESLARASAQMTLLPGHRTCMASAFEHVEEAFDCTSERDTSAMLAALALRLN